jgi:hypothetical protein
MAGEKAVGEEMVNAGEKVERDEKLLFSGPFEKAGIPE